MENRGLLVLRKSVFTCLKFKQIDELNLQRKSAAIACRRFPGTHSYGNIASLLTEIHAEFGLNPQKIVATTTDNGSNFVKAFQEFGIDISEMFFHEETADADESDENLESFEIEPEDSLNDRATYENFDSVEEFQSTLPCHLRCASHTLHLIATTDATKTIQASRHLAAMHSEALGRCTSLWKCLQSPKSNEVLKKHLGEALRRPIVTRWNSLYDCLKQIVSLKEKLNDCDTNQRIKFKNPLKDSDFRYIEEYLHCMQPLAEAIDILQGEKYCYYGYLLPTLLSLRRKLLQLKEQNTVQLCQPLLKGLIKSLESRFKNFFEVTKEGITAAIAAMTHPKFKSRWLSCLDERIQSKVRDIVIKAASDESLHEVSCEPANCVEVNDYFDFGEDNSAFANTDLFFNHGEAEMEIMRYMKRSNTDIKILDEFPLVRKLFVKYNTPLPSSAAVERLFSYATMMNLPKYNRLTDAHFEQRVLSKANSSKAYM